MSKQWGHGFFTALRQQTSDNQELIDDYGLKPRDGETARELLARENGYADGWCDCLKMSWWQFFKVRRAYKRRGSNVEPF